MRPATIGRDTADTGAHNPVRCPLFAQLVAGLETLGRPHVIDLGPACAALLERLAPMQGRLQVVDLPKALAQWQPHPDDPQPGRWFVDWLLPSGPRPADAVFAWDLPNYLPLDTTAALMRALAARCRRGALVHMLATYAHPDMPATPARYVPTGEDALLCESSGAPRIAAPRHTSMALDEAFVDLRPERAVLLKSGMQEMTFRVEVTSWPPRR